ncbi:hypothetical protein I858_011035 [Planococcus versutus]|uniref:Uncharacterized protein n=1 Tax=Planococcus versutus TaxID=1302659 RepID=A0A1B1S2W5_9BACL|nr:hypothetical protein I858_011035 [Planococcus versutus]
MVREIAFERFGGDSRAKPGVAVLASLTASSTPGRALARRGSIGCVYKLFEINRWRDILKSLDGDRPRAFA